MANERNLTVARAGREALMWEMERDDSIIMMGEDVLKFGGVFGTADGFGDKFGADRIIDTPISETGFVGLATGAAVAGMRPVVELAFVDFIGVCYSAIINLAAKHYAMSNGQVKVPMTLMLGTGGCYNNGAQHSQSLHASLAHIPGMIIVAPSNAHDAKGLMASCVRSDNFTVWMAQKVTSGVGFFGSPIPTSVAAVPEEQYTIPFGEARIAKEGSDITMVGLSWTVHNCLEAAAILEKEDGVKAEVIDPRTLVPLDREAIIKSVRKTGKLLVADEDYQNCSFTSEVLAIIAEEDPTMLKAPAVRVANPDITIPYSRPLELEILPTTKRIVEAARKTLAH